ncbi:MAG: SpoIIE family protein phosphatase [Lachnospiraceae bacterium]|nr:SpoIIE family protein phosphatase [Lachnospiraceae bacterium]
MIVRITLFMLILCCAVRGIIQLCYNRPVFDAKDGMAQTTGNKEIQADAMDIMITEAGKLAVLADGIGRENTGKVCAALAVKEFMDAFSFYRTLHNPEYFFERTMYGLHRSMQKVLEERQGGASVGVVFLAEEKLYYAMAGQVRVALLRGGELIPLCDGQTIGVLAQRAYQEGKLGRQETIWSLGDKDLWNYVGKDGFCQMELCEVPVQLKKGDLVVLMTKGIYEEAAYAEIERVLTNEMLTAQSKADRIVQCADRSPAQDKDNGSIMVLLTDGAMR